MQSIRLTCAVMLLFTAPVLAQSPVDDFASRLVDAAMERLSHEISYDGSYRRIDYPDGDVPDHIGVCTDLVVRAYRAVGIDLQQAVHEDMKADFAAYPQQWGLNAPDANIDHRRVPNLQAFFKRKGVVLSTSADAEDYQPGDLVTWMLPGNLPHIGIVVTRRSSDGLRPLIVHNIGAGPALEDMLLKYPITGHYQYGGSRQGGVTESPASSYQREENRGHSDHDDVLHVVHDHQWSDFSLVGLIDYVSPQPCVSHAKCILPDTT